MVIPTLHRTAYQRVKDDLANRIGSEWPDGTRLPPIAELARQIGAGHRSTHRAVRELAQEGRLISRPGLGTFVAGLDEHAPAPTAIGSNRIDASIAILGYQDIHFTGRMIETARNRLNASGGRCHVLPADAGDNSGKYLDLSGIDADALLVVNPDFGNPIVCSPRQILCVISTATDLLVAMRGRYDLVTVNQVQGGLLAGEWFAKHAIESFCFLGCINHDTGSGYDDTSRDRLRGFELGFGNAVPEHHRLLVKSYGEFAGARGFASYQKLSPAPKGVFAADDKIALGFIKAALGFGLEPGRDYSIIGFDGQNVQMDDGTCPLESVRVPSEDLGREAADMLISRFRDPDRPVRNLALGCTLTSE